MTKSRASPRMDNRALEEHVGETGSSRLFPEGRTRDLRNGTARVRRYGVPRDIVLVSASRSGTHRHSRCPPARRRRGAPGLGLMDLCVYGRTRVRGWLIGTVKAIGARKKGRRSQGTRAKRWMRRKRTTEARPCASTLDALRHEEQAMTDVLQDVVSCPLCAERINFTLESSS